jgi:hypothetical protein
MEMQRCKGCGNMMPLTTFHMTSTKHILVSGLVKIYKYRRAKAVCCRNYGRGVGGKQTGWYKDLIRKKNLARIKEVAERVKWLGRI